MHVKVGFKKLSFSTLAVGLLLLLQLTQVCSSRVHTAIGGYFSVPSTWADGIVPSCTGGETVVVASGATLFGNISCILGSKTQPVGPAVHLLANSNYYPLTNTTLTLRGYDASNNVMELIDLGGQFVPQPGSIVLSDCSVDGSCVITNNGYLKSSNVTWSIPSTNLSWNNLGSSMITIFSLLDSYNLPNVWVGALTPPWISNSEGTALGSSSDSSVSFTNQLPGTMHTEVATLEQVTSPGTYYINYDAGVVYWYATQAQGGSFTASYKYLTFIGGTIVSTNNAAGNQAIFDHSTFLYMGTIASDNTFIINAGYKYSTSASPNQLVQVTNSTFRYCKRMVGFTGPVNGTASNPILLSGNTIYAVLGDPYGAAFTNNFANSSYVTVQGNIVPDGLRGAPFVNAFINGTVNTLSNWKIQNNVVRAPYFELDTPAATLWPDSMISNNFIVGFAGGFDGREISGFGGTAGHPTIISNNVFVHAHRVLNMASYQQFSSNYIADFDHHGVDAPELWGDTQVTNVSLTNNIFTNPGDGPAFQLGYVTRVWLDNITIAQNTSIDKTNGSLEFGDAGDGQGSSFMTNLYIYNNLFTLSRSGVMRYPDTPTWSSRVHIDRADWCDFYDDKITYVGIDTFSTFTWNGGEYDTSLTRNVTGVSLGDTNYPTPQSGLSLAWTYTNPGNVTISWNGGTPAQLVSYASQVTSATNNSSYGILALYSGTLTDATQSFPTALNNTAVPAGMWVKIVGGMGAGQVRRVSSNTAQVLTVVPAWTTVPDSSSAYVLYKSEVKLYDASGSHYVLTGMDMRSTPTASATDVGIGLEFNTVDANPELVNSNGSWRTWDISMGGTGSDDAVFSLLSSNPSLLSNLLSYERQQFTPQNVTLNNGWNHEYIGATPPEGVGP
jgi:hypothetical protein